MDINNIEKLKSIIEKLLNTNKAQNIVVVNLKNKTSIADYMIVASGTSSRHIQSLSEIVLEKFKVLGVINPTLEGKESTDWKLIDGKDIIVHIFHPEKRNFYNLEKMWSELIPKGRLSL